MKSLLCISTDHGIDMDKLISVKGLVIRTTPIIPDMKDGESCFPHEELLQLTSPSLLPLRCL
jgi:hypothetical protein